MNKLEYLLVNLIEECSEVQKAATKAIRFGFNHCDPKDKNGFSNKEEIMYEFQHIVSIMELLEEYGYIEHMEYERVINIKRIKKRKIRAYIDKLFGKKEE